MVEVGVADDDSVDCLVKVWPAAEEFVQVIEQVVIFVDI